MKTTLSHSFMFFINSPWGLKLSVTSGLNLSKLWTFEWFTMFIELLTKLFTSSLLTSVPRVSNRPVLELFTEKPYPELTSLALPVHLPEPSPSSACFRNFHSLSFRNSSSHSYIIWRCDLLSTVVA